MKTTREYFAERLKGLRKLRGFSQTTLAEALGIDQATVQRWETQKSWPQTPEDFDNLAKTLGVPPNYFFGSGEIKRVIPSAEEALKVLRDAIAEFDGHTSKQRKK